MFWHENLLGRDAILATDAQYSQEKMESRAGDHR